MIRPLRRRHRWMISTLFLVLVIATVLALARPTPTPRVDSLPPAVLGVDGSRTPR